MNRIDKIIADCRLSGRKLLSPYITAGDPLPALTVPLMHSLVEAGADILEIGIPFSDPMAEGPVIQAAMERALGNGVHIDEVLSMIKTFRQRDGSTPIVLMGYLNPIEQYGYQLFATAAIDAGADATIIVDLPPEESEVIAAIWSQAGLYSIYLCSPTTSDSRMIKINQYAKGYLYYVSIKGVTGADSFELESVKSIYALRKQQTTLPIMVGFGIKSPEIAASVADFADGVIVGAALIEEILQAHQANQSETMAAKSFIESLRAAINYGVKES